MIAYAFRKLLSKIQPRKTRTKPKAPRCHLNMTMLEDRAVPATITVTTNADSGAGSLRAAIDTANGNADKDTIVFDIPAPLPTVIALDSKLPAIIHPVIIDGSTQLTMTLSPSSTVRPKTFNGLEFQRGSEGSDVYGLLISGFVDGVSINSVSNIQIGGGDDALEGNIFVNNINGIHAFGTGAGGTRIIGNWIGTSDGTTALLNSNAGIYLSDGSGAATIGSPATYGRNIISGNSYGIKVEDSSYNTIIDNYIGTTAAGNASLPNGVGIVISGKSTNNTVGDGTTDKPSNVISGNRNAAQSSVGILVKGSGVKQLKIIGNYIGTNKDGTAAITGVQQDYGIKFESVDLTTLTDRAQVSQNVISSNGKSGISVSGSYVDILSNIIGWDKNKSGNLTNGQDQINISLGSSHMNVKNNTIINMERGIVLNGDNKDIKTKDPNLIYGGPEQGERI